MIRPKLRLRGDRGFEVPADQPAAAQQLLRLPIGVGPYDYRLVIRHALLRRLGAAARIALEREEPERAVGLVQHADKDVIAPGGDGGGELRRETRAGIGRIRSLNRRPKLSVRFAQLPGADDGDSHVRPGAARRWRSPGG